ncbi:MAG TPA: type II secretion system minor pseudopilin GspH [Gammaproteobacteria bacterium]|nr:type II secretion system minor pseudopilin GspH [Gammaproteobacteria bacterium]
MLRSRQAANRGLTLMEILVVLVIVAVVAGFAVLSTASLGGDTPQEQTARRIAALLELASENAVMESKQFGVEIQPHGYQFYMYDGTTWQPITNDPTFRKRRVEDNVVLRLQLEGRHITLPQPVTALSAIDGMPASASGEEAEATQKTQGPQPQILALSSGELTPFNLEVASTGENASYHVRGHMSGKVQLIPPDSKVLNR